MIQFVEKILYFKNCKYLGNIYNIKRLARFYRSCNILFFPSINDCSPNVILEAMSSGLPVVAANSGGTPELILKKKFKGGVIYDKKNPILAIKTIIENYPSFKKDCLEIAKNYHDSDKIINLIKNKFLNYFSFYLIMNLKSIIRYFSFEFGIISKFAFYHFGKYTHASKEKYMEILIMRKIKNILKLMDSE